MKITKDLSGELKGKRSKRRRSRQENRRTSPVLRAVCELELKRIWGLIGCES